MRNHTAPGYLIVDSRFPGDISKHVLHDDGHLGPYVAPRPLTATPAPPERNRHEQNPIRA